MSIASRRVLWSLRGLGVALIGLYLATPWFTESNAWGLWPVTHLPPGWRWALAVIATVLLLFGDRVPWAACGVRFRLQSPWVRLTVTALATAAFYVFRIRHLRWGDADLLIRFAFTRMGLTYNWQAPLDVFIHAKAWTLGKRLFGWTDPTPAYWILSAAAGAVFVWTLLGFAAWLGRSRSERILTVGLVGTLGLMQLFFGYIENYTFVTVGLLIYLWLALRTLRGEIALGWAALALALAHALHPSTVFIAPSIIYLAYLLARGERIPSPEDPQALARPVFVRAAFVRNLGQIAVPYILVFAGVVALMTAGQHGLDVLMGVDAPGGGDRRWFVPLFQVHPDTFERYTMFSLGHLIDILNEQMLVAPVVWPGFILAAVWAWPRLPRRDPAFRLLFVIAGLHLLLTLIWNADYGGQKDWDLLSIASLPAAVLLAYTLPRVLPEREALRSAGWALIAPQAFHTIAWIYQNTLPWTKPK